MRHKFKPVRKFQTKQKEEGEIIPLLPLKTSPGCGECSACCTVVGVEELNKPHYAACKFLNADGHGCSIYAKRPPSCQGYKCIWLSSELTLNGNPFPPHLRPDRLGALFFWQTGTAFRDVVLIGMEVWPGGFDSPEAAAIIHQMAAQEVVVLVKPGSRRVLGPPRYMGQALVGVVDALRAQDIAIKADVRSSREFAFTLPDDFDDEEFRQSYETHMRLSLTEMAQRLLDQKE